MIINEIVDSALIRNYHNQEKRDYMGVSGLGDECARRIQLQYMHCDSAVSANQVRTFDIGHTLEGLVAQWLRVAGFDLRTENAQGRQFGFSTAERKIAGHIDGIIFQCPNKIKTELNFSEQVLPCLWECKTMNAKNWLETSKHGVFAIKFIYYVQVQLYMAYMDFDCCIFTALNKDTSELYFEKIDFDSETAQKYSDRAVDILKACENNELLPRLASDSSFFKCKMCAFYSECWKNCDK